MNLKFIILDVDGTMTDGGIYYDSSGNELKKFNTKDGSGIKCAQAAGLRIVVLTGRECAATARRLTELGINDIYQGVNDKVEWLKNWMNNNSIDSSMVAYIGDDINDIGPMRLCGYVGCPADAAIEVKEMADYVSDISGGYGAVRDVIEHILREHNEWDEIIRNIYGVGV